MKEWWDKNKGAITSATLDLLRLVLLAVIPYAIDRFTALSIPIELQVAIVVSLKWLDKYLHKYGKENEVEELVKGITRF